ncbi:MAG: ABC transporter permease, partial [Terriglobales bacterium]
MKLGRGVFGSGLSWAMILLLALGIGATTAMFSIVNGVLLKPLNLRDPGQVVLLGQKIAPQVVPEDFTWFVNPVEITAWTRQAGDLQGLAYLQARSLALPNSGRPLLLHGAAVTPNFFDVLEVRPLLGRNFVSNDAANITQTESNPIIITHQLWQAQFGADPGVIGRHVGPPGDEATIVGVLPAGFNLGGRSLGPMTEGEPVEYYQAWQLSPKAFQTNTDVFSDFNFNVIARLKPGVTAAKAQAQLNTIEANLSRSAHKDLTLTGVVKPMRDYTVADAQQELWLLLGGVLAVLLVVCVNLGGLWVTRIADRSRDWAIRSALGAAPGRLVRQVLGESILLAVVGGILGIICAAVTLRFLLAAAPAGIPRLDQVHLDWRVVAFGLGLSIIAGLITGLVPALRLSQSDPHSYLKASGKSTTADRSTLGSRQTLIAVQAALSTLLLVAAGLLGLSFYHLVHQPTGFASA